MISKPRKSPNDVKSYRPVSLILIIPKLFEKRPLKRMKPLIEGSQLISGYQIGFR